MFNTVAIVSAPTLPSPGLTIPGAAAVFFGAPGARRLDRPPAELFLGPRDEAHAAFNLSRREHPPLGPLAGSVLLSAAASGILLGLYIL